MNYKAELWLSQYRSLIQLHLDNGGHMDTTHHVFDKGLHVSWLRLDQVDEPVKNELMLYRFTNVIDHRELVFKVECLERGYSIKLVQAMEDGIQLEFDRNVATLLYTLEQMLWPTIKAFEQFWFD